jgi:hypothetical protein
MRVEQWLRNLGFAQYARTFAENDIDFDLLRELADADLRELGVSSLGQRKRLLAAIADLRLATPTNALSVTERCMSAPAPRSLAHRARGLAKYFKSFSSDTSQEPRAKFNRFIANTPIVDGVVFRPAL